jgi:hypothetical protein
MAETRTLLLLGALGAAVALFLYSRTERGAAAISETIDSANETASNVIDSVNSAVRGLRNNNPGNIRKNATAWQGLLPPAEQTDPAFFRFASMAYGIRAMVKILYTYQDSHNLRTVRQIIGRWAPPNENDTNGYVQYVADRMGVAPDTYINVHDEHTVLALVRAIIAMENGSVSATLIATTTIVAGIDLA